MDDAAEQRAQLIERLDRDREAVAEAFTAVRGRLKVAEKVVGVVQGANRHRALSGVLAALAVVSPFFARTWMKRAGWLLPLVIEGIRLVRKRRDDRDDRDGHDDADDT